MTECMAGNFVCETSQSGPITSTSAPRLGPSRGPADFSLPAEGASDRAPGINLFTVLSAVKLEDSGSYHFFGLGLGDILRNTAFDFPTNGDSWGSKMGFKSKCRADHRELEFSSDTSGVNQWCMKT